MIKRILIGIGLACYGFIVLHIMIFIVLGIVYVLEFVLEQVFL